MTPENDLIERLLSNEKGPHFHGNMSIRKEAADALIEWSKAGTRWSEKTSELQDALAQCHEENGRLAKMVWGERAKLADENTSLRAEIERLKGDSTSGMVEENHYLRAENIRLKAIIDKQLY